MGFITFFIKMFVRACVCQFFVVSLHAIWYKYAFVINCHRTCRGSHVAAERRCDFQERSQFQVTAYPSEPADERGWDPLLDRAGQRDAAEGREENQGKYKVTKYKVQSDKVQSTRYKKVQSDKVQGTK